MALPNGDLLKLTFGGKSAGTENWSIHAWIEAVFSTDPTPAQLNAMTLNALNSCNTNLWSLASFGLRGFNPSGFTLESGKLYWYRNGAVQGSGTASITPVVGSGSAPQPAYTARVVTLQTDFPGRSRRGRIYLPWAGQAPAAGTGLWGAASGTLNAVYGFLHDIATSGLGFAGLAGSTLGVVSSTHGLFTPVTGLRMDNKPDTQRGRERGVVATTFDTHIFP